MKTKEKVRVTRAEAVQPNKRKGKRPVQLEFDFISRSKGQDTLELRKLTYMDRIRDSLEENALVLTDGSEKSFHDLLYDVVQVEKKRGSDALVTMLGKLERLKIKHETRAEETNNPAKWAFEENKIELLRMGISFIDSFIDGFLALRATKKSGGDVDQYRIRTIARFGNA